MDMGTHYQGKKMELSIVTENAWLKTHEKFNGERGIDYLFKKLDFMYPRKWSTQFANERSMEDFKIAWAEEFEDSNFMFQDAKKAIEFFKEKLDPTKENWPPSCLEFINSAHFIDYEAAFLEAVEQMRLRESGKDKWSNVAVFYAARHLGCDMNNFPYQSIKTRWRVAIDDSKAKIEAGELPSVVPERLQALPSPEKAHTTPKAEGLRILAEMKRVLESKIVK
jgi:hypothetical protein